MTIIAPIKTDKSYKNLWFDANGIELKIGDKVIVETARGQEFGTVAESLFEASDKQLKSLKSELKPVKRIAKDVDLARHAEMQKKGPEGLPKFKELAAKTNPDMVPVDIEYLFDGRKAVFYFSAPERQDFRELVKKLSGEFHVRVDMHQIMERDKAKLVSGIGICGQELCCARIGRCPKHVSIKMAKAQGLSLSPENISGCCGKLLCCLDYEYEMYDEFTKRAPKLKGKIDTPEGVGVVTDINMPNQTVQIKYGDPEKRVRMPLELIDSVKKPNMDKKQVLRPNTVTKENWQTILEQNSISSGTTSSAGSFENISFSGEEKLSSSTVKELPTRKRRSTTISGSKQNSGPANKNQHKNNRNKNKNKHNRKRNNKQTPNYNEAAGNTRRRRSRTISTSPGQHNSKNNSSHNKPQSNIRPGQNSSGLRNN